MDSKVQTLEQRYWKNSENLSSLFSALVLKLRYLIQAFDLQPQC